LEAAHGNQSGDNQEKTMKKTTGPKGPEIEYREIGREDLAIIKLLWVKLIQYHEAQSTNFKDYFSSITFEDRKKQLLEKSIAGGLRIDLASDPDKGRLVGYCVTSLNAEKQGEIDSIYVEQDYRNCGIGDQLMTMALSCRTFAFQFK
jgi:diamine N-acetyltransferase